jgi:hypothetical protein
MHSQRVERPSLFPIPQQGDGSLASALLPVKGRVGLEMRVRLRSGNKGTPDT